MPHNWRLRGYQSQAMFGAFKALIEAEAFLAAYPIPEVVEPVSKALGALHRYRVKVQNPVTWVDVSNSVTFNRTSHQRERTYENITSASRQRLESALSLRNGLFDTELDDGTTRWQVMAPETRGVGLDLRIYNMYKRLGIEDWDEHRF